MDYTPLDASLRRLETDFIDLYQVHRFDPETPAAALGLELTDAEISSLETPYVMRRPTYFN